MVTGQHAPRTWGAGNIPPPIEDFEPYPFRSVATTGTFLCMDVRAKGFSADRARKAIAEIRSLRPLYLGDYYPLTPVNLDESHWCAWQFDRPEEGKGFAVFFRRPDSRYPVFEANLRGLDPKRKYEVTFTDARKKRSMTGAQLSRLRVEISSTPGTELVTYRRVRR